MKLKNPSTKPGKSKYATKIEQRKKLARSLGMSDAPFPVLLNGKEETEEKPKAENLGAL